MTKRPPQSQTAKFHPQTLTSGKTGVAVLILGLLMVIVSAYLTRHYFAVKFPTGFSSESLCNINSFFNCDKTIASEASSVAKIPISIFGIAMGIFVLGSLVFRNQKYQSTMTPVLVLNFLGCLALFAYSLIVLQGLCPFCTVYYVLSLIVCVLFLRVKAGWNLDPKVLAAFVVVGLVLGLTARIYAGAQEELSTQPVAMQSPAQMFADHAKVMPPSITSEYKLATAKNPSIRIEIFSDFECPGCKMFAEMVPDLKVRYGGQIDIEYFFFPLDSTCNPEMTRPMHPYACLAASIAACLPQKFETVHDDLFQNQEHFSTSWLNDYATRNKVTSCVAGPKTKEKIQMYIRASKSVSVQATPTFVINGVKFEGVVPLVQLYPYLDEIVKKASAAQEK